MDKTIMPGGIPKKLTPQSFWFIAKGKHIDFVAMIFNVRTKEIRHQKTIAPFERFDKGFNQCAELNIMLGWKPTMKEGDDVVTHPEWKEVISQLQTTLNSIPDQL